MDAGLTRRAALLAGALLLCGCEPGYYAQLIHGQYDLLSRRQPIDQLLAKPDLDPVLKQRLERAVDARRFASRELLLPDNGSYKSYADLERPAALWNVFAAPEFSLAAHEWCYWVTGCLAYRGYYALADAKEEAAELKGEGLDVYVSPVPAYSTLGWFDDPLLNTVVVSDDAVASTIFHELAHQKRFVRGDTVFNESFASFVEDQGLRQYFRGQLRVARAAGGAVPARPVAGRDAREEGRRVRAAARRLCGAQARRLGRRRRLRRLVRGRVQQRQAAAVRAVPPLGAGLRRAVRAGGR